MVTQQQERFAFAMALAEEISRTTPRFGVTRTQVAALASQLIVWATQLNRLNERECNELDPDGTLAVATAKLQKRVREALAPYKIGSAFQGDPRGPAIRLRLGLTGASNDWGGEGYYCVPEGR